MTEARVSNVLYLGWIGFHNAGDELMWELFRDMAGRFLDPERFRVVPSMPGVPWEDFSAFDTIVLGGGSLLIGGYVDKLHSAVRSGKRIVIWGSGYDCIHLPKSREGGVVKPGKVEETPAYREMLAEVVEKSVYTGVRGPWTEAYLRHQGVPKERITVCGDPGLLASLAAEKADPPGSLGVLPGPSPGPSNEERWIGLNWGTAYNRIYGADETAVEDQLAAAAQAFIRQGYRIYLYVMWGEDREPAKRLYGKIGRQDRTALDLNVYPYKTYMELMRRFSFTLNYKLHANVLSAAAEVPFVSLGYRFKCFDFAFGMGVPELVVPTDAPDLQQGLAEAAVHAEENRDSVIGRLRENRDISRERLTAPFRQGVFG